MHRTCMRELDAVFFGSPADRSKSTRVPSGAILGPRLETWYTTWSACEGLFRSTMDAKHKLQMEHVQRGCVSDPEGLPVSHAP
jgi:hypothetical protein